MLYRKIEAEIEDFLKSADDKILVLEGARQVGKSFIIRKVGTHLYKNFVEINFAEDDEGPRLFKNIHSTKDFYFTVSMIAGEKLDTYEDTLIFLDEIQHYPQYLTMLKFFRQERRYRFIASGSLLGIALRSTTSIPIGSILPKRMYQLDFEEFLVANGVSPTALYDIRSKFNRSEPLSEELHNYVMKLFRRYLVVGGLPDVVNIYLETHNIVKVREVQSSIVQMYKDDASKYEKDAASHLHIGRIYEMIPSQMENKKKRIVAKDIQGVKGDRFDRYQSDFEYLISSGITLPAHAVSNPKFPLNESLQKNLLKLYLNDVGLLTMMLFKNNVSGILEDLASINLGSVYESVVAQELAAHNHQLYYYDNRHNGEVDFLVNDYTNLSILPIEVKSGKDYTIHSALNRLLSVPDYHVKHAWVLSNEREIKTTGNIVYLPIYFTMFLDANRVSSSDGDDWSTF